MFHRVLTPTDTGKTQEEKDTIKDDLDEDEKEDRLIKQLDDSNPERRRRAFWRLLELLNDEEDRVYQRKMLKDNNPEIRARAILSLGWVEGKEVMAEIIKKLDDDNEIVRSATLRMIVDRWMSELDTTGYMPAIISKLNDTSSYIRSRAIGSLYELEVKEAIPDIKKRLKDNEKYIRMTARKVLEEWGVEIPEEENKDE